MDERPHNGQHYPQPPQQSHVAPWPTDAAPSAHAPISDQMPHAPQAQPSAQQFQYAASGYVLPGAPQGQAPMSAHGGTIGMAQPHAAPAGSMPMLNGGAAAAAAQDPFAQPQAWAFPTPQGMQLVQGGPAAQHHQQYQQHQHAPTSMMAMAPAATAVRAQRRLRWETIIPAAAMACLVAAVALFISDFDQITGRESSTPSAAQVGAKSPATIPTTPAATEPTGSGTTDAEAIAAARKLFAKGQFDEAKHLVHPLVARATPNAVAVALHARIAAASARNTALLTRLSKQRREQQWSGVVSTINALAALRPLSADLTALRIRAKQAASASTHHAAAPSTNVGSTKRTHGATPPAAGGTGHATTGARPPASVAPSAMPPRPDAPNPISGHGTGAGAVGGGCVESMPGMDMCPG
jgi:hypothetical protein